MRTHLTLALLLAPCVPASSTVAATAPAESLRTRFTYTATVATVPPGTKSLRVWVPVPSDNPFQTIGELSVSAPGPHQVTTEPVDGNRMVHVEADPSKLPVAITVAFDVTRTTAGASGPADLGIDPAHYLHADRLVPIAGRSAELGREVAGPQATAAAKMRAIYDHVVATMQYDYKKESPKLGQGDVPFVCDYKKGNCSDLHSYVIALARSQGVPAFLEYGFPVTGIPLQDPVPLTGTVGGYHCWTWFHDGTGWVPLDASDGRRWLDAGRPDVKDQLAGRLVLERSAVAFSRGRDVTLAPPQQQPPLNFFIYPHAEADGEPVEAAWTVAYELAPPEGLEAQVAQLRALVIAQQAEIERLKAASAPAVAAFPPAGSAPAAKPMVKTVAGTGTGEAIQFYGQLRLDVIHDSAHLSPHAQTPFWAKSPDDPAVAEESNDHFTMHPRLTRLGLNLRAPDDAVPGWTVTGKVEMDFQGGGSESRPTPRARLLYADFKKGAHAWRVGQDWDVIAPLLPSPNDDSVMWNAGNLGDRRGQLRYTYDDGPGFTAAGALVLTGAIDAKDLDANGVRDGEDSGLPGLQARFGWKGAKGAVGVWGHRGWEETTHVFAGDDRRDTESYGLDFLANPTPKLDVRGELFAGKNLADVRGGIGQGVNGATGKAIPSRGGWLELGGTPAPKYRLAVGYTLDDPDDDDVPASGRLKNWTAYASNKLQLGANLELGVNFIYWETDHQGLRSGIDRRINTYLSRKF